jgi:hypothetical protein
MKTIITILLASVSVMGQDIKPQMSISVATPSIRSSYYKVDTSLNYDFGYYADEIGSKPVKPNCFITIQDLIDYKRECWNDSTLRTKEGMCLQYSDFSGTLTIGIDSWYDHKTPTFKGFMEWIEKRKQ